MNDTPDGTKLASGSEDGTVKLWRVPKPSNVEQDEDKGKVNIYPNPAGEYIEISGLDVNPRFKSWVDGGVADIRIYSVLGESVKEIPPTPLLQRGTIRIDVSVLPAGVYFIQVGNDTEKFVVVR